MPLGILILFWAAASGSAYQVTLLPAARVFDANPAVLDANLGFPSTNLLVEAFEGEALIPGINTNLKGHRDTDLQGEASAWDGQWASSPSDLDTTFTLLNPGVRTFGIGIGQNGESENPELSINSGSAIRLQDLPGYVVNDRGRAFYLKIQTEPKDPDVQNVRFTKAFQLRFDHLVVQCMAPAIRPAPAMNAAAEPIPPVLLGTTERPEMGHLLPLSNPRDWPTVRPVRSSPSPEAWGKGVSLLSQAGELYIGGQAKFFFIDPDGVLTSSKPQWLSLYQTEGNPFRLHGEVWLASKSEASISPDDLPDGFAIFAREWDGTQRYALSARGVKVQKRLLEGKPAGEVGLETRFEEPKREKWIPFYLEASWDRIGFYFGDQVASIAGPLDVDGANKIVIAPGTKLRNLRLELFYGQ